MLRSLLRGLRDWLLELAVRAAFRWALGTLCPT